MEGHLYFSRFAIFTFLGYQGPSIFPKVNRLIPEDTGLDSQAFNSTFLAGTTVTAGGKTLVLDYRPANTPAMSASVRLCRRDLEADRYFEAPEMEHQC